ncbi:cytochrome c [Azovibrio restrictus]|uniref:cytochrome c n=1 Tax=Azovibrio restrictus TaxID=146938 RepID=UPI0026ECCD19|nr:cytochrome c [Azovibrio restrictus]MDD3481390.1 cytochrome c [Azovibrio restrictus]
MRPLILPVLLFPLLAHGVPELDQGDPVAGKSLHDKDCISCHQRMYGGDGSRIYTRDGRVLSDKLELLQRVAACNAQMNTGWFPDEEAHVARYLNQQYYQFKQ